jgi:hypothetical protein
MTHRNSGASAAPFLLLVIVLAGLAFVCWVMWDLNLRSWARPWRVESPGVLALEGSSYRIVVTPDGTRCDATGPFDFHDWSWRLSRCKKAVDHAIVTREAAGMPAEQQLGERTARQVAADADRCRALGYQFMRYRFDGSTHHVQCGRHDIGKHTGAILGVTFIGLSEAQR